MPLNEDTTPRGFRIITFDDRDREPCSLQESSLAEEAAIWLGPEGDRMHLTQQMVAELLPYLETFAETGELG